MNVSACNRDTQTIYPNDIVIVNMLQTSSTRPLNLLCLHNSVRNSLLQPLCTVSSQIFIHVSAEAFLPLSFLSKTLGYLVSFHWVSAKLFFQSVLKAVLCAGCEEYHFLHEGLCVLDCPERFFEDKEQRECLRCHPDCALCDGPNSNDCDACLDPEATLHTGACLGACPSHNYRDAITGECKGTV